MKYEQLQKSKPELNKKLQSAPKMMRSGTSVPQAKSSQDKQAMQRLRETGKVADAAKALARELGIPIISPSQANRGAAKSSIIEGDNAAGSYEKIMIGDIIISLARGRKDKVNGTGRWHFMKNRYGADGLTFGSKIDTSNGKIDIYETPLDDVTDEVKFNQSTIGISTKKALETASSRIVSRMIAKGIFTH